MDCALKDISILVVEDDPDTRELLKVLLQSQGGEVTTAASVPEALSAYDNSRPNVIVADIGMPDYNGYALIANIRKQEANQGRTTPVIALTAYSTPADRDTALTSGFTAYLSKPFEPQELVDTIRTLYDQHTPHKAA